MNEMQPEMQPEPGVDDVETLPLEPGSIPEDLMDFEEADDAPPDSDLPEDDQALGDAEVDDGEEEDSA